jgi:hypothetical protein
MRVARRTGSMGTRRLKEIIQANQVLTPPAIQREQSTAVHELVHLLSSILVDRQAQHLTLRWRAVAEAGHAATWGAVKLIASSLG